MTGHDERTRMTGQGAPPATPPTTPGAARRRPWGAAIVVLLAVIAYALVAGLQILVWNPLAAAPGLTLDQIRAEMAEANEAIYAVPVLVILGLGVALTAALLISMLRSRAAAVHVVLLGLALVACGAVAYFMASFNVGMSLADAFAISGGDHAPWGAVLMAVSLAAGGAAMVVGAVLSVSAARRKRP